MLQQSNQLSEGQETYSVDPVVFHLLVTSTTCPRRTNHKVETVTRSSATTEAHDSPRSIGASSPIAASARPRCSPSTQPSPVLLNQPPVVMMTQQQQQQQQLFGQTILMQQQTTVLHQIQYLQYLLLQQRHHQQQVQTTPLPAHIPQQLFGAPFALPYGHFYGMMPPQMVPEQMRPQGPQMILPARAHVPAMAPVNRQNPWMVVDMAREVVSLLDLRMAIKMAFMLVIIGQDMSTDRMLMLGLLSLISYLYITGILAKIHEVYKRHRSVHGDPAPNAPAGPNARGAEANADAAMADRHSIFTRVLRISADRGFVQDIKYFVVGLLLSLVPAWHPQPLHGAAPVHGDAVPNNMPLQEM